MCLCGIFSDVSGLFSNSNFGVVSKVWLIVMCCFLFLDRLSGKWLSNGLMFKSVISLLNWLIIFFDML